MTYRAVRVADPVTREPIAVIVADDRESTVRTIRRLEDLNNAQDRNTLRLLESLADRSLSTLVGAELENRRLLAVEEQDFDSLVSLYEYLGQALPDEPQLPPAIASIQRRLGMLAQQADRTAREIAVLQYLPQRIAALSSELGEMREALAREIQELTRAPMPEREGSQESPVVEPETATGKRASKRKRAAPGTRVADPDRHFGRITYWPSTGRGFVEDELGLAHIVEPDEIARATQYDIAKGQRVVFWIKEGTATNISPVISL